MASHYRGISHDLVEEYGILTAKSYKFNAGIRQDPLQDSLVGAELYSILRSTQSPNGLFLHMYLPSLAWLMDAASRGIGKVNVFFVLKKKKQKVICSELSVRM